MRDPAACRIKGALGLYTATTGTNANYVREDLPYLTRGSDIVVGMLLALAGLIGAALGYLNGLFALGSLPAYLVFAVLCRAVQRRRLRGTVDEVLNELQIRQVVRPIRSLNKH